MSAAAYPGQTEIEEKYNGWLSAKQFAALQPAGVSLSLHIGQRVRHQDDYRGQRVTGVVRALSIDSESGALKADVALDAPIVIPPINDDDHELRIYTQCVSAHELAPFDEREELITGMVGLLRRMEEEFDDHQHHALAIFIDDIRAQIAKATKGGAA